MAKVLTFDEACEVLRVSKSTVYDWREQGTGPPFFKYTEGRTSPLYILEDALTEWIREQANATGNR